MVTRHRDFQSPLGALLTFHIGEIVGVDVIHAIGRGHFHAMGRGALARFEKFGGLPEAELRTLRGTGRRVRTRLRSPWRTQAGQAG